MAVLILYVHRRSKSKVHVEVTLHMYLAVNKFGGRLLEKPFFFFFFFLQTEYGEEGDKIWINLPGAHMSRVARPGMHEEPESDVRKPS